MTSFTLNRTFRRAGLVAVAGAALALGISHVGSTPASAQAAPGVAKPVINLLCKFPDIANEPGSADRIQQMFTRPEGRNMDKYFQEASYGAVNLSGTQTKGWFTMPHARTFYGNGGVDSGALMNDCVNTAVNSPGSNIDLNQFAIINAWYNSDDLASGVYGFGYHGQTTIGGVNKNWQWAQLSSNAFNQAFLAQHEMAHGFGMTHVAGFRYDATFESGSCPQTDPAGGFGCWTATPNAYNRGLAGWLPADRVFTYATSSGAQQVTLARLDQPAATGKLVAKVPIGNTGTYYAVEMRGRAGYDGNVPDENVVIFKVDEVDAAHPNDRRPSRIVLDPTSSETSFYGESGKWRAGETFTDAANGIAIRIDSVTTTGAMGATITINPSAAPATPTPTATPSPTPAATPKRATQETPWGTLTLTASATSNGQPYAGSPATATGPVQVTFNCQLGERADVRIMVDGAVSVSGGRGQTRVTATVTKPGENQQVIGTCRSQMDGSQVQVTFPVSIVQPAPTVTATPSPTPASTPSPTATPSPASTPAPTTTPGSSSAPATPANVHSTAQTGSSVSLAFNASAGATSYKVQYQKLSGGPATETTVSSTSPTVSGLASGTWYTFKVAACNGGTCSTFSDSVTVITAVA